jgi:hypothetical protein
MAFCTTINCMDGRTQLPVIEYLMKRCNVEYVDSVTEAGPVRWLAEHQDSPETAAILRRVRISTEKHGSRVVALVTHHDCAGNPVPKDRQMKQLEVALSFLRDKLPDIEVVGLWVTDSWQVQEV